MGTKLSQHLWAAVWNTAIGCEPFMFFYCLLTCILFWFSHTMILIYPYLQKHKLFPSCRCWGTVLVVSALVLNLLITIYSNSNFYIYYLTDFSSCLEVGYLNINHSRCIFSTNYNFFDENRHFLIQEFIVEQLCSL